MVIEIGTLYVGPDVEADFVEGFTEGFDQGAYFLDPGALESAFARGFTVSSRVGKWI